MVGKSKRTIGQLVRCAKCGAEKPWDIEHFAAENGKPRNPCRDCRNAARDARAKRDPEQTKAGVRSRMARWRANNPDKVQQANRRPRSINKELARQRVNSWKRARPESRRVEYHRRKSLKLGLPDAFTAADWERCLAYWGHRCCVCGREADDRYALAQEHWIPLASKRPDNPGTAPWNILPMCHARPGHAGGCNNAKHARDPETWIVGRLGVQLAARKLVAIRTYFNAVTPPAMRLLIARCLETLR